MPRPIAPHPFVYDMGRRARAVQRRHWFWSGHADDNGEVGDAPFWADALSRISVTGETLVVDVPEFHATKDRREQQRIVKRVHATIRTTAGRRALPLTRHWDGRFLYFQCTQPVPSVPFTPEAK